MKSTRVWQLLLACCFLCTSCEDRNFVVDPATVCRCDAGVDSPCSGLAGDWQHTVDNLLEVSAHDFTHGDFVGTECQGETGAAWEPWPFYFNSWRPVNGFKLSMSGTLHHFNWNYDDDEDWNLHVIPKPAFSSLITDVEALHDESVDDHDKCGGVPCMEAEISPDKQFWTNPWFFVPGAEPDDTDDNGYSWLEGKEMGFYGLWIMDANHDFKAEIHPADMMWFNFGGSGSLDIFWLLFLQDNTGRFDDRDNFDCDGDAPAGWEPWAQSPRSGQFNIAFEVNPATEVVRFSIVELFKRFVVTAEDADARRDADDGKSHALEYNGREVVIVDEDQPNDNDLGVTFTNICVRPDGKLQGYVSIRTKIGGDDDKDEEGFHILYAARTLGSTRPVVPKPDIADLPRLLVKSKEVGGSLKGSQKHFAGDIQLTLLGDAADDYTISKVEFTGEDIRQEIKFEQSARSKEAVIRNVPLIGNGKIIVSSASGLEARFPAPVLSLYPVIDDTVTVSALDQSAGKFLSASVGGVANASLPDKGLVGLQEHHVRLYPGYAALKGTGIRTDRTSSFATDLNRAITENDKEKLEALFGSTQPFKIEWTFAATNLATGKPVPVYSDRKPGAGGVQIQMRSDRLPDDSLDIRFLSPGSVGIIECHLKASVTDAMGETATVEHRVWSHGFLNTVNNVDECATLVQGLTGLEDRSVLFPPRTENEPAFGGSQTDLKVRRAHLMNAALRETVRDRQVTIGELRSIIRALKEFTSI